MLITAKGGEKQTKYSKDTLLLLFYQLLVFCPVSCFCFFHFFLTRSTKISSAQLNSPEFATLLKTVNSSMLVLFLLLPLLWLRFSISLFFNFCFCLVDVGVGVMAIYQWLATRGRHTWTRS